MSRLSSDEERKWEIEGLKQACEGSFAAYRWRLVDKGWPRELARMVLPLNTYSHMFAKVNPLNLLKFLTLRLDPHAQYEKRVYAEAVDTGSRHQEVRDRPNAR